MLKPQLPPDLIKQATQALKENLEAIINVGEVTQTDYKINAHYVNIIFEIKNLIKDLKNANRN